MFLAVRGCTSTFRGCSRTLKTPNSPPPVHRACDGRRAVPRQWWSRPGWRAITAAPRHRWRHLLQPGSATRPTSTLAHSYLRVSPPSHGSAMVRADRSRRGLILSITNNCLNPLRVIASLPSCSPRRHIPPTPCPTPPHSFHLVPYPIPYPSPPPPLPIPSRSRDVTAGARPPTWPPRASCLCHAPGPAPRTAVCFA